MASGQVRVYMTMDASNLVAGTREAEGALTQLGEKGTKSVNGLALAGEALRPVNRFFREKP